MTIRFASGRSHFGFWLVDLVFFILVRTILRDLDRNDLKRIPVLSRFLRGVSLYVPSKDTLLGRLSDAGNLD